MSLRLRLLLVSLVLLATGLSVAGLVTHSALASFLRSRVDTQLDTAASSARHVIAALPPGTRVDRQQLGAAAPGIWVQLRPADGSEPLAVQGYAWTSVPRTPALPEVLPPLEGGGYLGPRARLTTGAAEPGGGRFRVLVATTEAGDTLVLAASEHETARTLDRLIVVELVAGALIMAVAALSGLWLIRLGLRPLARIEAAADDIAEHTLTRPLPGADAGTEVGRLARALNTMLARLDTAFGERRASEERLRRFVADASHELRTPITAVRAYAELYRRRGGRGADADHVIGRIEHEAERLGRLVDDLLLLARLDDGQPLALAPVDLGALAADGVDAARVVEPGRPVQLVVEGSVEVHGDRDRLRQVVDNLLANVRTHTPPGAPAVVTVRADGPWGVLEVADRGPGLSEVDRARAFERFYRADPSRARDRGGSGLGLSILAAIVEAHGGTAGVEPHPGGGSVFRVALPRVGAPTGPSQPAHSHASHDRRDPTGGSHAPIRPVPSVDPAHP